MDQEYFLTRQEVVEFHERGVLGPFRACSVDEMTTIREHVVDHTLGTDGPWSVGECPQAVTEDIPKHVRCVDRHVDCALVSDLCRRPEITERMASLSGGNVMLMHQMFWNKQPGGKEIPWHQDGTVYANQPQINVTAWIALDPATEENGCVELVPGSHRQRFEHVEATGDKWFDFEANPDAIEGKTVSMELEPGEFFLFTESTLHRSSENTSDRRRLGMSMQCTVPFAYMLPDEGIKPHHYLMMLHGENTGINDVVKPPQTCEHEMAD